MFLFCILVSSIFSVFCLKNFSLHKSWNILCYLEHFSILLKNQWTQFQTRCPQPQIIWGRKQTKIGFIEYLLLNLAFWIHRYGRKCSYTNSSSPWSIQHLFYWCYSDVCYVASNVSNKWRRHQNPHPRTRLDSRNNEHLWTAQPNSTTRTCRWTLTSTNEAEIILFRFTIKMKINFVLACDLFICLTVEKEENV